MSRPVTPLKLAIAGSGRTQRELADALGLSEAHFSRIVNGLHASKATRQDIADELGQTVDHLWPSPNSPERAA